LYVKIAAAADHLGESFRKLGEVVGVSLSPVFEEQQAKVFVISGMSLPEVVDFAVTSMPSLSGGVVGADPGYGYGGTAVMMTVDEMREQLGELDGGNRSWSYPYREHFDEPISIPVVSNRKRAVAVRKTP
jgi:hypothetical protein